MSPSRHAPLNDTLAPILCVGPAKQRPSALTRKFSLIVACVLAPLSLATPERALAQCSGPAAICNSDGNPYANGINVGGNTSDALSITLGLAEQAYV